MTFQGLCIFWPAFGCCAHQTLVVLVIFSFFCKILQQISYFFALFKLFGKKMLKMNISTSIWRAQHPNASQNIQQRSFFQSFIMFLISKIGEFLFTFNHGKRELEFYKTLARKGDKEQTIIFFGQQNISGTVLW